MNLLKFCENKQSIACLINVDENTSKEEITHFLEQLQSQELKEVNFLLFFASSYIPYLSFTITRAISALEPSSNLIPSTPHSAFTLQDSISFAKKELGEDCEFIFYTNRRDVKINPKELTIDKEKIFVALTHNTCVELVNDIKKEKIPYDRIDFISVVKENLLGSSNEEAYVSTEETEAIVSSVSDTGDNVEDTIVQSVKRVKP